MNRLRTTYCILLLILFFVCNEAFSQLHSDTVIINFHQSKHDLDLELGDNKKSFDKISETFKTLCTDSIYRISKVSVIGAASPEGSISFNKELSRKRALTIFDHVSTLTLLPDSVMSFTYIGRDWKGLLDKISEDKDIPYREEVDSLVRLIIEHCTANGESGYDWINKLKRLRNGSPYLYMYKNIFPDLRATRLMLTYEKRVKEEPEQQVEIVKLPTSLNTDAFAMAEEDTLVQETLRSPIVMALKSNLLYDALLVPNIGAEFYLGKDMSLSLNWQYAWWNTDNWYWRIYGGEIAFRKWFGSKSKSAPLTGHHVGVFGQAMTYDFMAFGKKGYMSGDPGEDLYDHADVAIGVEYGYSTPISKRLNLDFVVGFGYHGGSYNEYRLVDNCYEYMIRKKRQFIGPLKAEVTLSWMLNIPRGNAKKGGTR